MTFISGSTTCLSDEESRERVNVHPVYSASQGITNLPDACQWKQGRLDFPGDTQQLSCVFCYKKQSSGVAERLLPALAGVTQGFQRLACVYFIGTWEKLCGKRLI